MSALLVLSRFKRAVAGRMNIRAALHCVLQRNCKAVEFTGIASVAGRSDVYASLAHFRHNIPVVLPRKTIDYLVAQQFLTVEFTSDQRPKVFFSREPAALQDRQAIDYLQRDDLTFSVLSFGEKDIKRRMFYVALPDNRARITRRLRRLIGRTRPGTCCIVNRYSENRRLNLLPERIRFVQAMGKDIDVYGRNSWNGENGWYNYPNYRGAAHNKIRTLRHYNFNLCFENCDEDGYITEKIIHALIAGCIPLYWGGGRFLEQTIPSSCFINCNGQDPIEVHHRIRTMTENQIIEYRKAGIDFISSAQADHFTWRYWAEEVSKRLLES